MPTILPAKPKKTFPSPISLCALARSKAVGLALIQYAASPKAEPSIQTFSLSPASNGNANPRHWQSESFPLFPSPFVCRLNTNSQSQAFPSPILHSSFPTTVADAAPNGRRLCALSPHFVDWNKLQRIPNSKLPHPLSPQFPSSKNACQSWNAQTFFSPSAKQRFAFLALGAVLQSPPMRPSQFRILQTTRQLSNLLLSFRKQPQGEGSPSTRREIPLLFGKIKGGRTLAFF